MRRSSRVSFGPLLLMSMLSVVALGSLLLRLLRQPSRKKPGDANSPEYASTEAPPIELKPPGGIASDCSDQLPQPPGGTVFVAPETDCVVPLTVEVKDVRSYYIYLKFLKFPANSALSETPDTFDTGCSDIGFFAAANDTVSLKVPVGVFSLMYASGLKWQGLAEKFGSDTRYYKARQTLTFNKAGNHLYGNTIQLFPQTDGNTVYHQINRLTFDSSASPR